MKERIIFEKNGVKDNFQKKSDVYEVKDIPERFDNPRVNVIFNCSIDYFPKTDINGWFKGYGKEKQQHPMYITSSSIYGRDGPSIHTFPSVFYAKSQKFTNDLGKSGMYRNCSLNCNKD
ncbi:hypothetical protein A3Q56_00814 [Intoshia linei]|uniref:Uncharacterized protein n=1 Tax=Intoshia linei TaxID=1819745 RepID=A0A177BCK1_9BILA|nr:hypothetical protein A3Q56_00814 [Intoshia linei]